MPDLSHSADSGRVIECRHFVTVPLRVGRLTHFCHLPQRHHGDHESCHLGPDGRPFRWRTGQTVTFGALSPNDSSGAE